MRKCVYAIALVFLFSAIFCGCSGDKKLTGEYAVSGVKVSYAPAVGKTIYYRSDADVTTEFTEKGYHSSTLSKTTQYESFTINDYQNDTTTVTYRFIKSETGVFKDGSYKLQDREDEIIGQYLTLTLDPDGKLIKWSGLEDVEPDESGVNKAELTASQYASLILDYFPPKPIKVGESWVRENVMNVSTEQGDMHQKAKKTYTVVDFVEKNGKKCVKCNVKIVIDNTGEGTVENEGKSYKYFNEGKGQGNGVVYFDFENGYPILTTINWIIDFTINSIDLTTKEESKFRYFQEQKVTYNLIDKKDVPK